MITLWGVWDNEIGDWQMTPVDDVESARERVNALQGMGDEDRYEVRLVGQYVRVPPEVIEAAKRMRMLAQVGWWVRDEDKELILNWIAQAVTEVGK